MVAPFYLPLGCGWQQEVIPSSLILAKPVGVEWYFIVVYNLYCPNN
jgi:hypothetical protein